MAKCEAVLRMAAQSAGADNDVREALELGLQIYYKLDDMPAN